MGGQKIVPGKPGVFECPAARRMAVAHPRQAGGYIVLSTLFILSNDLPGSRALLLQP